jgi:hypothetical protein
MVNPFFETVIPQIVSGDGPKADIHASLLSVKLLTQNLFKYLNETVQLIISITDLAIQWRGNNCLGSTFHGSLGLVVDIAQVNPISFTTDGDDPSCY